MKGILSIIALAAGVAGGVLLEHKQQVVDKFKRIHDQAKADVEKKIDEAKEKVEDAADAAKDAAGEAVEAAKDKAADAAQKVADELKK